MLKSQPRPFPSLLGLVAIALTIVILVSLAPWLHEVTMPALGLSLPWDFAVMLVMAFAMSSLLTLLFKKVARQTSFDEEWLILSKHMPRHDVAQDMKEISPYLNVLGQQLDGVIKETENAVVGLISSLNSVHTVSDAQIKRINTSIQTSSDMTKAMQEKMMADKQLAMILQMFVDQQEKEVVLNLGRIKRLQEVKGLTGLVSEISLVAKQTNILAINAAVEAARAGDAGRGFAVLAAEIRTLANRTADAAVNISAKIKLATDGIEDEERNANTMTDRNEATGSMRSVIAGIDDMQQRFAATDNSLLSVIEGVREGHEEIVMQLSDAMGQIQFQDVIRQRVGHVQHSLEELDEHLQCIVHQLTDQNWDPQTMVTMRDRLDAQVSSYVMQSQVDTHNEATGKTTASVSARPNIELF